MGITVQVSLESLLTHLQHTCGLVLECTDALLFIDLARYKRLCYNYCIQILLFVYVGSGTVWCTFVSWLMVIKTILFQIGTFVAFLT